MGEVFINFFEVKEKQFKQNEKIIMKKECILVMGFRHLHIGKNFTSKRIYILIQVKFHLIQNLNPIGIKISNQFVCCYLINPIKNGIKNFHMSRKRKRKPFFTKKNEIFFYNQQKTTNVFFFFRRTNFYYIQILFLFLRRKRRYLL